MHGDECRIAYPCTLKFTRFTMYELGKKTKTNQMKINILYTK